MKTEFREENQNYVMTFEGRLDTPSSLQVERDMQVLYDFPTTPNAHRTDDAGCSRLRGRH